MLELDAGAVRRLGGEPNLPLAGLVRIGLDLPLRADVPTQEHPVGRLVGQHARPAALAAVDAAVIDVTADARFKDRFGDRDGEQIVLGRLEAAEILGEDFECALDRSLDDNGLLHGRDGYARVHFCSSGDCSTTTL